MRAIGCYAFALLQSTGVSESGGAFGGGLLELLERSSLLSQAVLVILGLFSVASWAVILVKLRQFRRVDVQTARFSDVFRRSSKFSEVQSACQSLTTAPWPGFPGGLCD